MKITYIGKKTVVKDQFKEYAEKRLRKLEKFFDDDPNVTVVVSNNNEEETVEVTIKSHGMFFRAEKTSDDRQVSHGPCGRYPYQSDCPQSRTVWRRR